MKRVLTPKLPPPPPWQAQNRSGWDRGLTLSTVPEAVTTWVSSRESQVRPWCLLVKPNPPPSSSPVRPTDGHRPVGAATPVPASPA